jgi:hypothetical protein
MRKIAVVVLLAGQLAATAPPAFAAELVEAEAQRIGTFGGVRLRMRLGGNSRDHGLHGGLSLAPTLHSQRGDGASHIRFGEGLELGVRSGHPVTLSFAGTPVDRLGSAQDQSESEEREAEDERSGPSPLGWAAIGIGVGVALAVGGLWIWASSIEGE